MERDGWGEGGGGGVRKIYTFRPLPFMKEYRWMTYHLTVHTVIMPINKKTNNLTTMCLNYERERERERRQTERERETETERERQTETEMLVLQQLMEEVGGGN